MTREMVVRIIADAVMVNAALAIALTARCLWAVSMESSGRATPMIVFECVEAYLRTCWLLTVTSAVVFYASGFYTRGRVYRGRYKALVIAQAVSLSYLIFGFEVLLLRDLIAFPRTVLLMAWFLTLVFVGGARLWVKLWSALAEAEHRLLPAGSTERRRNNVLIIGGAGYIGAVLTGRLLDLGYHVRVLDLLLYGDDSIAGFYGHPRFDLVRGDFRHVDAVVRSTKGMDAIVHLGAIVGDSACTICEDLTIEINLRATRTIAEVGKGFGVGRFVFASTCSVYGTSDEVLDERSALRPMSLYARTKVESERVLLKLADASFAPTILRFGTIYGLSSRPRFDLVVNLLTAKGIQEGKVGIFGGNQWRPLVHVKDVAEAIVLTLQAPPDNVRGQIFNVGCNEQNYQIADLGHVIQEIVPEAQVVTLPEEDNRNYRVSFEKIRKAINYQPRYSVRDGVLEIMHAFHTGAITDYKDPRYSNYSFLSNNRELQRALQEDSVAWDWIGLQAVDEAAPTERTSAERMAPGGPSDVAGPAHGLSSRPGLLQGYTQVVQP